MPFFFLAFVTKTTMNDQQAAYAVYGMAGISSLVAVGSITNGFDQVCASNKSARDWKNVNMMLAGAILACSAAAAYYASHPGHAAVSKQQKIVTLAFLCVLVLATSIVQWSAQGNEDDCKATGFSLATSITGFVAVVLGGAAAVYAAKRKQR
jgi:hypothetical protein